MSITELGYMEDSHVYRVQMRCDGTLDGGEQCPHGVTIDIDVVLIELGGEAVLKAQLDAVQRALDANGWLVYTELYPNTEGSRTFHYCPAHRKAQTVAGHEVEL